MGIPRGIPEIQKFYLKQLKPAYFKHFEHFQLLKNLKKQILLQTTVNICENVHNNMTFTTVELKIA